MGGDNQIEEQPTNPENNGNLGNNNGDREYPDDNANPNSSIVYTVMFDSQGGSYVPDQVVKEGETAGIPEEPDKDDNAFMGWYTSEGFSFRFNFKTPISQDITLYAKWWDMNDTIDSDGDGLYDHLEHTYGTDPNNVDTDGDGLSDYDELNWLEYNPLVRDTDGNGVDDGNEDADGDGLSNFEEVSLYHTDMIIVDTDNDGLTDYEEVELGTDPLNPDTDSDGVSDGVEVAIGSDPLTAENVFATTLSSDRTSEDPDAIDIAVTMHSSADVAGTLQVTPADYSDHPLITPAIPGYLAAYNIRADGEFDSAEITFKLGNSVWVDSEDFQPRIYYLNEDAGILEEIPDQTVSNGIITASVSHFSIYVLINQVLFNGVWNTEIRLPSSNVSADNALNIVFVIDCSSSMSWNDPRRLAISLSQEFIDKLSADRDQAAAVRFNSSAYTVSNLTNDMDALKTAIDAIKYNGSTNGSDGLNTALNILDSSTAAYKFIVFLTDGDDNYHSYTYDTLIEKAISSGVIIYTIGMGSAVERTLKEVALGTGGAYYKATTGTAASDVLNLDEVFTQIQSETIDMVTDSNGDKISDYFTKLLNDGQLVLSNGSSLLDGVTDYYGVDNDDWDGDGIKNGDEITIVSVDYGDRVVVTAYMKTNPLLWDTDFDGYSDYDEINNMHTSPLKYTIAQEDIAKLIDDSYFPREYINASMPDDSFADTISMYIFAGDVKKKSIETFINYFQKYSTSEEILAQDALAERRLQQCKDIHDGIVLISDIIKTAKTIVSIGNDIGSDTYDADENARKVFRGTKERLDKMIEAKFRDVDSINSISKAALFERSAQKAERDMLENMLNTQVSSSKEYISGLDSLSDIVEDFLNEGSAILPADMIIRTTNAGLALTKTIMDISNTYNKINIPCKWEWMSKVSSLSNKITTKTKGFIDGIGGALQVVVTAAEIASSYYEVAATYGQIAANCYEYQKYLALLRQIENDERFSSYVRAGAAEVAGMFNNSGDPDWEEFEKKLKAAKLKAVTLTVFKGVLQFGIDQVEKTNLVLLLADVVYNFFFSHGGIQEGYDTLLNAQIYYAITDASRNLFSEAVELVNGYLQSKIEGDSATKYAVQIAQSRIAGVETVKKYLLNGKLVSKLIGWVVNKSEDDIKKEYEQAIKTIHSIAEKCRLGLSDNLPRYD